MDDADKAILDLSMGQQIGKVAIAAVIAFLVKQLVEKAFDKGIEAYRDPSTSISLLAKWRKD